MAKIILYGPPQSTYVRTARMLCEEKKAKYKLEPIEFGSAAHRTLHPFAKVPVCRVDDELIYETSAICAYLDATLPGKKLTPSSAIERAHMERWISMINAYCYQTMSRELVLPRFGLRKVDDSVINDAVAESERQARIADGELAQRPYLAGESLSIADLFLAPIIAYLLVFPDMQERLAPLAHLQKWFAQVSARDSFKATEPPKG